MDEFKAKTQALHASWVDFRDTARSGLTTRVVATVCILIVALPAALYFGGKVAFYGLRSVWKRS